MQSAPQKCPKTSSLRQKPHFLISLMHRAKNLNPSDNLSSETTDFSTSPKCPLL